MENSANSGLTVLGSQTIAPNYISNIIKPRIIEFYGTEGEDFRYFSYTLESFFALNGITNDRRKVLILKTQLRRSTAVFFKTTLRSEGLDENQVSYDIAIGLLQDHYISPSVLQKYQLAFQEMFQAKKESPQQFLTRLYEAADLAAIDDDEQIHIRFRTGLLLVIKAFCREQGANSFNEWVKAAEH